MSENDLVRREAVLDIAQRMREDGDGDMRSLMHAVGALPASPALPPDAVERVSRQLHEIARCCCGDPLGHQSDAGSVLAALGGGA
jgi:hypothetical protein